MPLSSSLSDPTELELVEIYGKNLAELLFENLKKVTDCDNAELTNAIQEALEESVPGVWLFFNLLVPWKFTSIFFQSSRPFTDGPIFFAELFEQEIPTFRVREDNRAAGPVPTEVTAASIQAAQILKTSNQWHLMRRHLVVVVCAHHPMHGP